MTNIFQRAALAVALLLALSAPATSAPAVNTTGHNVGLSGYDAVSYFPEGGAKPQKGLIGISFEYQGVTYRFRTKENLARFEKNPSKYAPQYNGWCAWAMGALDKEVDIDPQSFLVRNGKLYVFYGDPELNTRELMLKDEANLFAKAEANWKKRTR